MRKGRDKIIISERVEEQTAPAISLFPFLVWELPVQMPGFCQEAERPENVERFFLFLFFIPGKQREQGEIPIPLGVAPGGKNYGGKYIGAGGSDGLVAFCLFVLLIEGADFIPGFRDRRITFRSGILFPEPDNLFVLPFPDVFRIG